jgi:putative ABC transport system permease protein
VSLLELIRSAIGNSLRSKTRTLLTVVVIVIGAFTLTLTTGAGTGMTRYIDKTLSTIGPDDVLTVSRTPSAGSDEGPAEYQEWEEDTDDDVITRADLTEISQVAGVLSVTPVLPVEVEYVQYQGGEEFETAIDPFYAGMSLDLAAGRQMDAGSDEYQVALPQSYRESFGVDSDEDVLGKTITLGTTDPVGEPVTLEATVTGVSQTGIIGGSDVTVNPALLRALWDARTEGLPDDATDWYPAAVARFDPAATDADIGGIEESLAARGYDSTTVRQQIGSFMAVINAILFVLNGFAVIALLAAGLGIVNTLLMAVQERTREIGLMKAMGMAGHRVFALFSLEAIFIGVLGGTTGVALGIVAGDILSEKLRTGLLSDLPGLTLVDFSRPTIALVFGIVVAIAFLAGTVPAVRAAQKDPIESLRYE